jgi:Domain of unknown function (DUF4159)
MQMKKYVLGLLIAVFGWILVRGNLTNSPTSYTLARLKYGGGGDWYGDKTALPNLARFCNKQLKTNFNVEEAIIEPENPAILNYPYVFATGHGNIQFTEAEAKNIRKYLLAGGFLHFCDNYGMDPFIRPAMKKVFPELTFVELPYTYPLYHQTFSFPKGLPKIHEHDSKRAQGFGLIFKGRLVCFYDYECDLGNGWEDIGTYPEDDPIKHDQALRMGSNLIEFVFKQ